MTKKLEKKNARGNPHKGWGPTQTGSPPKGRGGEGVSGARQILTHTQLCWGDIMGTAVERTSGEVAPRLCPPRRPCPSNTAGSTTASTESCVATTRPHQRLRGCDNALTPATLHQHALPDCLPNFALQTASHTHLGVGRGEGRNRRGHTTTSLTLRNSHFL